MVGEGWKNDILRIKYSYYQFGDTGISETSTGIRNRRRGV